MNLRILFYLIVTTAAFVTRGDDAAPEQPLLQWQNGAGRMLEASFVKLEERTLFLRKADGTEVRVPLEDLEEGSKLQAMDLARRGRARAAKAAHDQGTYRLRMYPKAVPFTLDVLDNGKGIDYGPFMSEVVLTEQTPDGEKTYRSQGMKEPLREKADETQWRGRMQNQMQVDIRIQRAEKSLTLNWELLSAEKPLATLQARVSLVFPALDMNSAQKNEVQIRAVDSDGQSRLLDTSSASDAFQGEFRSLELSLPGSKTTLSFKVPESGNGSLGLYVEPTKGLADGFRVDTRLKNPSAGKPASFQIEFLSGE